MADSGSKGADRGVAIVTGGRRGIGAGVAVALAREGFKIVVADVVQDDDAAATIAAIEKAGSKGKFVQGDISDLGGHSAFLKAAVALGPLTCLVNNAGVNMPVRGDMLEVGAEVFDKLLDVNLRGTFFLTQAVAKHMLEDARNTLRRSITFITSANVEMVSPEKSAYCISKAALGMTTKLFAARLGERNIDVFEVQPGLIKTQMNKAVWETYGKAIEAGASITRRWGEPADVGQVVAALSTGALPFCTGTTIPVGGGLHVRRL